MAVKEYALSDVGKMMDDINARHKHLIARAMPISMKDMMDSVLAQARTKTIRHVKTRAKVPRWVIARKFPAKLQRKANIKDFYKDGKMSSKSQMLVTDVQGITVLSKRASGKGAASRPPVVDSAKMEKLQKSMKGITLGKAGNYPNAFVADGRKREMNPNYDAYLRKNLNAGPKVLQGKYWQVLERQDKSAYPIKPVTIPIDYAGRVLKKYTNYFMNSKGPSIFKSKLEYAMKSKVRF